ncbi:MAG: hypothetical protein Q9M30_01740 [Mariprofundaceae bacterium]|nr:hypothetical protein [Mariprofundaceae bacterium]
MQAEHIEQLRGLLRNMDACARNIEQITERECDAARHMNVEALSQLSDLRARSHQALASMEEATRLLLARCGAPPEMTLSTFIDMNTPQDKGTENHIELQSLRRNLYERMLRVHASGNEARLHLKAAHDVTVGVLQHIGAIEKKQTYGPRSAA